jgi:hypothetical protein
MNAKYDLNHTNVESNIPLLSIKSTIYPFERENHKNSNLIPFAVDAALSARHNPILDGLYTSRAGYCHYKR